MMGILILRPLKGGVINHGSTLIFIGPFFGGLYVTLGEGACLQMGLLCSCSSMAFYGVSPKCTPSKSNEAEEALALTVAKNP